jgi:peptide chain release factor 3
LQKGLQQLAEEGATQLFRPLSGTDLILGAVGTLQFDVVASRLENEYGVQVIFEHYNCATARWIHGDAAELRQLSDRYSANVALDGADDPVYLAPNNVYLNMVKEKYPNLRFLEAREVA